MSWVDNSLYFANEVGQHLEVGNASLHNNKELFDHQNLVSILIIKALFLKYNCMVTGADKNHWLVQKI